jgi:hypothetical protein
MDPRIQIRIRIHTKMSWIRNTGRKTKTLGHRSRSTRSLKNYSIFRYLLPHTQKEEKQAISKTRLILNTCQVLLTGPTSRVYQSESVLWPPGGTRPGRAVGALMTRPDCASMLTLSRIAAPAAAAATGAGAAGSSTSAAVGCGSAGSASAQISSAEDGGGH